MIKKQKLTKYVQFLGITVKIKSLGEVYNTFFFGVLLLILSYFVNVLCVFSKAYETFFFSTVVFTDCTFEVFESPQEGFFCRC
jgi:hypothetical protein